MERMQVCLSLDEYTIFQKLASQQNKSMSDLDLSEIYCLSKQAHLQYFEMMSRTTISYSHDRSVTEDTISVDQINQSRLDLSKQSQVNESAIIEMSKAICSFTDSSLSHS